jgi:hypothetical protein
MNCRIPRSVGGEPTPIDPEALWTTLTDAAGFAAAERRKCRRTTCSVCNAPSGAHAQCTVCMFDELGEVATALRARFAASQGGLESIPPMDAGTEAIERWLATVTWLTAQYMDTLQRSLERWATPDAVLLVVEGAMYARRLSPEEHWRFATGARVLQLINSAGQPHHNAPPRVPAACSQYF